MLPRSVGSIYNGHWCRSCVPKGSEANGITRFLAEGQHGFLQGTRVPDARSAATDKEVRVGRILLSQVLRAVLPMGSSLHRTEVRVEDAIGRMRVQIEATAVTSLEALTKVNEDMGVEVRNARGVASFVSSAHELELEARSGRNELEKGPLIEVHVGIGQKKLLALEIEFRTIEHRREGSHRRGVTHLPPR